MMKGVGVGEEKLVEGLGGGMEGSVEWENEKERL
jgi:hypothetical protein